MLTLPDAIVALLVPFATLFTSPTWRKAQVLLVGAILTPGQRTVAAALRVMGLSDQRDYARYHEVQKQRPMTQRRAAWYDKPSPTFVDDIALVRRHLWLASEGFSTSAVDPDTQELPVALYHRLVDSLAYAA